MRGNAARGIRSALGRLQPADIVRADVLATAAVAHGPGAIAWLEGLPGVEALVVATTAGSHLRLDRRSAAGAGMTRRSANSRDHDRCTDAMASRTVADRLRDLTAETRDEAVGRRRRHDPVLPRTGGPAGNATLTAWTGLLLLVLFLAEMVTLLDVHGLISWHIAVGALLDPTRAAEDRDDRLADRPLLPRRPRLRRRRATAHVAAPARSTRGRCPPWPCSAAAWPSCWSGSRAAGRAC